MKKQKSDNHRESPAKYNRLRDEKSPYLLQHAHNPVDWYPWGEEAFHRAEKENKPVFLSVGYSTCHWCHVMAHESFEDPETARILNRNFIPIKVDREERPEIDDLYMKATQLMTGSGGWPNSVFLTPEGKPWFAGTYFPPEDRFGRPGFKTLLTELASVWKERRGKVENQADKIWEAIEKISRSAPSSSLPGQDTVDLAVKQFRRSFDSRWGGFGSAPKFPPHGALRLLLDQYRREKDPALLEMITVTLDRMARGGIRDHLGGGFHRYSTDERWFAPHFEKMLYDNAQLLKIYADAYELTGEENYRRGADQLAGWVLGEMRSDEGGFYSALDADSEGEEGKFYLWSREEIISILDEEEGELFCRAYGVTGEGNFPDEFSGEPRNRNILYLPQPIEKLAPDEGRDPGRLRERLKISREKLLARRRERIPPHLDDKILTDWNGLMIGAIARAGRILDRPEYLKAAEEAAGFIGDNLYSAGRLLHTYRDGAARINGFLDDYAFLTFGLLELYQTTGDEQWLEASRKLADSLIELFEDTDRGGFYFTGPEEGGDGPRIFRSRSPFDRAIPSGNGMSRRVLINLFRLTGEKRYRESARKTLAAFSVPMRESPEAGATLVLALAEYLDLHPAEREDEDAERREKEPVTVRISQPEGQPDVPGRIDLTVRIDIADGFHINSRRPRQDYLVPTSISLSEGSDWKLIEAQYPPGEEITPEFSPEPLSVYRGTVEITVRLESAKQSPGPVVLRVDFQPCDDASCQAPETVEVSIEVPSPYPPKR